MKFRSEKLSVLELRSIQWLKLVSFGSLALLAFFSICFGQVLENLEIIWKTTWPDFATGVPDSCETFGISFTGAGDVNKDGYDDILIGCQPVFYVGAVDTPPYAALLYYGSPFMDTIPDLIFYGKEEFDQFGGCVAGIGDINVDGYDDIAIGAPKADNWWGKAYIYFGGSDMDTVPDLILHGRPIQGCGLGGAFAHGDINGDGYDDMVTSGSGTESMGGLVFIYFGGPEFDTIPDWILTGHQYAEDFGISLGSGVDLNMDGFDDIIVGAWLYGPGYPGRVYIYFGGDPMDGTADAWLTGEGPNQHLGLCNVDLIKNIGGYSHAIAGTPLWPNGFFSPINAGKVYVLYGGTSMDTLPDLVMVGKTDSSRLGFWNSSGGDANSDEFEEILSGATDEIPGGTGYLWLGSLPMDSMPDGWISGGSDYYAVGGVVASAGDVDGDGEDEPMFSNYMGPDQLVWICKFTETGVEETPGPESLVQLWQNWPNPFRESTLIRCSMPAECRVYLAIYDIQGRIVKTFLKIDDSSAMYYETTWNGEDDRGKKVPSGIYFCRLMVEGYWRWRRSSFKSEITKKMVLIK